MVGEVANDPLRLRAVQRPGLAVGTENRDLDDHLFGLGVRRVFDHELHHTVGGLGCGQDLGELDSRVDVLEFLPVDRFDNLTSLQLTSRRRGRTSLDVLDLHHEGGLMQFNPHADRPEAVDRLQRCPRTRRRGE